MQKVDREFMEFLGMNGIPFAIIFTKEDKLKPQDVEPHVKAYQQEMLQSWESLPPMFVTSSSKFQGKDLVLDYIESVINKTQGK